MIQLLEHFTYKKLIRFTIPTVAMMIFTSVYGVVDGLFVSNVAGSESFAGVYPETVDHSLTPRSQESF